MWLPRHDDASMNNAGIQLTAILAGFLAGAALAMFGVGIGYAISIGIVTCVIVFCLLFSNMILN